MYFDQACPSHLRKLHTPCARVVEICGNPCQSSTAERPPSKLTVVRCGISLLAHSFEVVWPQNAHPLPLCSTTRAWSRLS